MARSRLGPATGTAMTDKLRKHAVGSSDRRARRAKRAGRVDLVAPVYLVYPLSLWFNHTHKTDQIHEFISIHQGMEGAMKGRWLLTVTMGALVFGGLLVTGLYVHIN